MHRLSSPIHEIKEHYKVVVVGSGYGGAIAASRLARAGQQVCLLERGVERHPGEYPNDEIETLPEIQTNLPSEHLGKQTALYDFHINDTMTILVGCGLGGTSLINANVSLRPDPRVFDDPRWPQALRDDLDNLLEDGYQRAEAMLKPVPYPQDFPSLAKAESLELSAGAIGADCYRLPINVTFENGVNHVGVEQRACVLCGDCISGCNYWAKNTTLMNYLPDARNHGAEIYCQISVRRIERHDDHWRLRYQVLEEDQETFDGPLASVGADIVILAAGTLGSTEILLRSQMAGLSLSEKLGQGFSGNGDVGGIAYNADRPVNSVGFGRQKPGKIKPVGPTITSVIDLRKKLDVNQGVVIEEGSLPGSLAKGLPVALAKAARLVGEDTDRGLADQIRELARKWISMIRGAYHGAVLHSQIYLVMSHDDSGGQLNLVNDRIRIIWPDIGRQSFVRLINAYLAEATQAIGGTIVENPAWRMLPSKNMVTAHPLGGCIMGEDASQGVVNHKGQVFSGANGTAVHDGLFVCDGAVIPRSLGANPLLTISAVAERCCSLLAEDNGWQIDYD
ncbi:MAG TPA: GMC family oxidoreductase [Chloroflexi bacterium]|nr:GMC family oxidoreductase [Chloroflexota bacterium]